MRTRHIILVAIIAILTFILGFQLGGKAENKDKTPEDEYISADNLPIKEIILYDCEDASGINEMSFGNTLLTTSKNDTVQLQKIISAGSIVGRFSVASCKDCIIHLVNALVEYKKKFPTRPAALLISGAPVRELNAFRNEIGNQIDVFIADSLVSDFDDAITPYLFEVSDSFTIRRAFIPRKEIPALTYNYLELNPQEKSPHRK